MSQLPKIVRDRLVGAPAAALQSSHPDADLLTAFIEGALSERERQQLLSHLAACVDCRDVVALSIPEFIEERNLQVAAAPGAQNKWWNLSALRWATVSATAVVVLAAVLLTRPSPRSQSRYVNARITSDAGMTVPVAKTQTPATNPDAAPPKQAADQKSAAAFYASRTLAPKNELRDKLEIDELAASKPRLTAPSGQVAVIRGDASPSNVAAMAKRARTATDSESSSSNAVGQVSGGAIGGVGGGTFRTAPAAPSKAANQPPSSLDQAQLQSQVSQDAFGQVQTQTTEIQVESQAAQKKDSLKESNEVSPAPQPAQTVNQRAAAAPAVGYGAGGGVTAALPLTGARSAAEVMATPTSMVKTKLPLYRWTIDGSGKLQRSSDGKTWEVVPVAEGAKLQSLAVVEKEIWTGGAVGLLYHSDDGGNRWTRVRPSVGDTVLNDDITRITLPNPQQVTLTTASSQQWLSTDGGKTWHKQ